VCFPIKGESILQDWDLWGPLILCLALSFTLALGSVGEQAQLVFTGVFAIIWIGAAIVTLNAKLLGGNLYVTIMKS
jgi:hypothetical protein